MTEELIPLLGILIFMLCQSLPIYFYNKLYSCVMKKDKRWFLCFLSFLCALLLLALVSCYVTERMGVSISFIDEELDFPKGAFFMWLGLGLIIQVISILISVFKHFWSIIRGKEKIDWSFLGFEFLFVAIFVVAVLYLFRIKIIWPTGKDADVKYIASAAVLSIICLMGYLNIKGTKTDSSGESSADTSTSKTVTGENSSNSADSDARYAQIINRCEELKKEGKYGAQIPLLLEATELPVNDKKKLIIWQNLGLAYDNIGSKERAAECYNTAKKYEMGSSDSSQALNHGMPQTISRASTGGLFIWAIIALLMCPITGIIAVVKTARIRKANSVEEQQVRMSSARTWCIISTVLGVLMLILVFVKRPIPAASNYEVFQWGDKYYDEYKYTVYKNNLPEEYEPTFYRSSRDIFTGTNGVKITLYRSWDTNTTYEQADTFRRYLGEHSKAKYWYSGTYSFQSKDDNNKPITIWYAYKIEGWDYMGDVMKLIEGNPFSSTQGLTLNLEYIDHGNVIKDRWNEIEEKRECSAAIWLNVPEPKDGVTIGFRFTDWDDNPVHVYGSY